VSDPIDSTTVDAKQRYEENGVAWRFMLGWRQALFGGYLVVLYSLASFAITVQKEAPNCTWLVPLTAAFLTLIFWGIESRTRTLYYACIRAVLSRIAYG